MNRVTTPSRAKSVYVDEGSGPARIQARRGGEPPEQVVTTKVGLRIPAQLSFSEWELAGRRLSGILDSSCWWLGDWLVYGKEHYNNLYQRGVAEAGLQYQTLRNYAWVARRFALNRRRPGLTFQHHAELASLPVPDQDSWLDRAEDLGWTTKQLRSAVRLARESRPMPIDAVAAESDRKLSFPSKRMRQWQEAAARSGIDFDQWVQGVLDHAAQDVLGEQALLAPNLVAVSS